MHHKSSEEVGIHTPISLFEQTKSLLVVQHVITLTMLSTIYSKHYAYKENDHVITCLLVYAYTSAMKSSCYSRAGRGGFNLVMPHTFRNLGLN